jgi:NAD(P)-dependent dehydrogenase (short-subunit alcohol dehydrogenase family)
MRALDPAALGQMIAVNAIGPALVAKHLLPLTPRGRPSVFAALSARVGSIGDNRLGGWHGYRASKAALNMLIRTLAIEHRRTRPVGVCVALHPGTVDTALSAPFQSGVRPEKLFSPTRSATALLQVMDRLGPEDSGGFFAWDGAIISW